MPRTYPTGVKRQARRRKTSMCEWCLDRFPSARRTAKFCCPEHKHLYHKANKDRNRKIDPLKKAALETYGRRCVDCIAQYAWCDPIPDKDPVYVAMANYDLPRSVENSFVLCRHHFYSRIQRRRSPEARQRARENYVHIQSLHKAMKWLPKGYRDIVREAERKPFLQRKSPAEYS